MAHRGAVRKTLGPPLYFHKVLARGGRHHSLLSGTSLEVGHVHWIGRKRKAEWAEVGRLPDKGLELQKVLSTGTSHFMAREIGRAQALFLHASLPPTIQLWGGDGGQE